MCFYPITCHILKEEADLSSLTAFDMIYLSRFLNKNYNRKLLFYDNYSIPARFGYLFEEIQIPCGKCDECKLKHSKQWSARCVHEAEKYTNIKGEVNACFLTLTYNNENLPYNPAIKPLYLHIFDKYGKYKYNFFLKHHCGKLFYRLSHRKLKSFCVSGVSTLRYKDVQLFIKRLRSRLFESYKSQLEKGIKDPAKRRKFRNNYKRLFKIRFFCSSEYGGQTKRPHYHMIIYNFVPRDLWLFKSRETSSGNSYSGFPIYRSQFLDTVWNKGMVFVGTCTQMSAGYVARYTLEKVSNKVDPHFYDFREREGLRMSRRNGIGFDWIKKNMENMFNTGYFIIEKVKYGLPRYYRKIMERFEPLKYQEFKVRLSEYAHLVTARFEEFCSRTNVTEYEAKKREERYTQSIIKRRLQRRLNDLNLFQVLKC